MTRQVIHHSLQPNFPQYVIHILQVKKKVFYSDYAFVTLLWYIGRVACQTIGTPSDTLNRADRS